MAGSEAQPSEVSLAIEAPGAAKRTFEKVVMGSSAQDSDVEGEETECQDCKRPGSKDAMIAALPERQRLALSLVYFEGLSNIEAAAVMEVSIEAVESLLARARRSLKESLSAEWRDLIGGLAETGR